VNKISKLRLQRKPARCTGLGPANPSVLMNANTDHQTVGFELSDVKRV